MESSSKIALGIVGAALLLVVGYVGYSEYQRARNVRELKELVKAFPVPKPIPRSAYIKERVISLKPARRVSSTSAAAYTLSDSQQCIGHTVVDVQGSTYVQRLGRNGRPIACKGRFASQRLR